MHWTYCGVPKSTSRAEAMLNREKFKPVALAIIGCHKAGRQEGSLADRQAGRQAGSRKFH